MSVYVFIFNFGIYFFPATEKEYRKWVRHRMLTAQRKGWEARMRKPSQVTRASQSLPLRLCPHISVSLELLFLPLFCRLPFSALSAQRKGWLRSGAHQRTTRASEFPVEEIWLAFFDWVRGCGCSLALRERELWTGLSLQWCLHHEFSVLWFTEKFH